MSLTPQLIKLLKPILLKSSLQIINKLSKRLIFKMIQLCTKPYITLVTGKKKKSNVDSEIIN